MIETVALLLAHTLVFGSAWALGLPAGFVHPGADPKAYARALGVLDGVLFAVAFLAAMLGVGAVAWVLWAVAVGASVALDVNAVAKRRQLRAVRRRFDRRAGR